MDITVEWEKDGQLLGGDFNTFIEGAEYTAQITLTAKEGYAFAPISFRYYPEEAVADQPGENLDANTRVLSPVTYKKTAEPIALNPEGLDLALRIPAPVVGASPVTTFYAGDYGGAVTWKTAGGDDLLGTFRTGTAYTAKVTLYAAAGYTLGGGPAFTYSGSGGSLNSPDEWDNNNSTITGMIIDFPAASPATNGPVTDMNLTDKIPAPVKGGAPVTYFAAPQYTGTVTWTRIGGGTALPHTGLFEAYVVYKAEVLLKPTAGYSLGMGGAQPFYHSGAVSRAPGSTSDGHLYFTFAETTSAGVKTVDKMGLTAWVPAPASGGSPVTYFSAEQYTGNVAWFEGDTDGSLSGYFRAGSVYTAVIHLTAKSGYTLDNASTYSHTNAQNVYFSTVDKVVTLVFKPAGVGQFPVTDRDLAGKFAAPVPGGRPAAYFAAVQYTGAVDWSPPPAAGQFAGGTVYTATVTLTPASGYSLSGLAGAFTYDGVPLTGTGDASKREVTITFPKTAAEGDKPLDDGDLTYKAPRPQKGAAPVTYFAGPQYTGNVDWTPAHGLFAANTAYTATVTLGRVYGYDLANLDGVPAAAFFSYGEGGTVTKYDADKKVVTIVFTATAPEEKAITDLYLTYKAPAPVAGAAPVTEFSDPYYRGKVKWARSTDSAPHSGPFADQTEYTATITLTAEPGWTFTGVKNVIHARASGLVGSPVNTGATITVTFGFPPASRLSGPGIDIDWDK
jgi:hypothetical protein